MTLFSPSITGKEEIKTGDYGMNLYSTDVLWLGPLPLGLSYPLVPPLLLPTRFPAFHALTGKRRTGRERE